MATRLKETAGYSVRPLHPCIGAEVTGIDLTQELSAETIAWIRQAWACTPVPTAKPARCAVAPPRANDSGKNSPGYERIGTY